MAAIFAILPPSSLDLALDQRFSDVFYCDEADVREANQTRKCTCKVCNRRKDSLKVRFDVHVDLAECERELYEQLLCPDSSEWESECQSLELTQKDSDELSATLFETECILKSLLSHEFQWISKIMLEFVGITPQQPKFRCLGRYSEAVCCSTDRLISADSDCKLRVWNLETGDCVRALEGHENRVCDCCISHSLKFIVSGSCDATVKIWELKTGRLLHTLHGHDKAVRKVCISRDDQLIASASTDRSVKIWELKSGLLLRQLLFTCSIRSLCMFGNSRLLAGCGDGSVRIWNLRSGEMVDTFSTHRGPVCVCCHSAHGQYIITGGWMLNVWDAKTYSLEYEFSAGKADVTDCQVSADDSMLISGWTDTTVRILELETGLLLHSIFEHSDHISSTCITLDSRFAITSSYSTGELYLWDLETGWYVNPRWSFWHEERVEGETIEKMLDAGSDNQCREIESFSEETEFGEMTIQEITDLHEFGEMRIKEIMDLHARLDLIALEGPESVGEIFE